MGDGEKIIAIDSHIDTVGIGNIDNWEQDPYKGYETDEIIYGRGGSDQEGGMESAVYGAKIMKDLDLIPEGYKIMIVGSVQEEDCDGMCWQYIYNKDKIVPEFVISTEPTDGCLLYTSCERKCLDTANIQTILLWMVWYIYLQYAANTLVQEC